MATRSNIEWTEVTWNPVVGCTKVSAGCKHCYAERMAKRLQAMGVKQYRNGFKLTLVPHLLSLPTRWRQPRTVFVNSMSDIFHRDIPLSYIKQVFAIMNRTPHHTYQLLTKRAERLAELAPALAWTPNIWMGVSVESERVTHRIPLLGATPASTKFLSIEPLLGPLPNLELTNIDWVIVGGESGPAARPMRKEWVLDILARCQAQNIPFFFKQWGTPRANPNPSVPTLTPTHPHHAKGGCQIDGRLYREVPGVQ